MRFVRLTTSPSLMSLSVAEQHRADLICSRLSTMPTTSARKREQLTGHRLLQPVNARDAVGRPR